MALRPRPSALLCLSDRLAEGALQAAAAAGLRVPDDLTVVGFDDAQSLAAARDLTTVHQPSREKGVRAARLLLDLVAGRLGWPSQLLATQLIIRDSSAAPASDG